MINPAETFKNAGLAQRTEMLGGSLLGLLFIVGGIIGLSNPLLSDIDNLQKIEVLIKSFSFAGGGFFMIPYALADKYEHRPNKKA